MRASYQGLYGLSWSVLFLSPVSGALSDRLAWAEEVIAPGAGCEVPPHQTPWRCCTCAYPCLGPLKWSSHIANKQSHQEQSSAHDTNA